MKLRSALLIACLIIVPLLAMVSHKIPAATRVAVRQHLWDPMIGRLAVTLGLVEPPTAPTAPLPSAAPDPTDVHRSPAATADAIAPAVTMPLASLAPPPPSDLGAPLPDASPAARQGSQPSPPEGPPAILGGLDTAVPIGGAAGSGGGTGRELLEARLRSLGATRIDWTPAQGGDGLHRCSCRIPAEPTGQLHRVFQSSASDPVAALDNLVGQVTAWSMRTAGPPGRGVAVGPSTPLR